MEENCGNCSFFNNGLCRRFPPQLYWNAEDHTAIAAFPDVSRDDWCGEWATTVGK
jgi:hypothetical protein